MIKKVYYTLNFTGKYSNGATRYTCDKLRLGDSGCNGCQAFVGKYRCIFNSTTNPHDIVKSFDLFYAKYPEYLI